MGFFLGESIYIKVILRESEHHKLNTSESHYNGITQSLT